MNHLFKITLLSLMFLSITVQTESKELEVNIQIKKPTASKVFFSYTTNSLTEDIKSFVLNIKENGEVLTVVNVEENIVFLNVSYNRQKFEVFINNINKLDFEFNGNSVLETLNFKGEGSAENNFLNKPSHQLDYSGSQTAITKGYIFSMVDNVLYEKASATSSFTDYKEQLSQPTEMLNEEIDQLVVDYLNIRNEYRYYTNLLTFFLAHQFDASKEDLNKIAVEQRVLEGIDFQVDFLLDYEFYTNFLQTYIYYQYLRGQTEETKADFAMYDISNSFLQNESRDWVLCKLLLNAHREQNTLLAEKKFFSLKQTASNKLFIKTVEELYGSTLTFNPDGAAPNFTLKSSSGEEVQLSDFRGKVVYISFWASWCKPCLTGFIKSEGIRHQLMDRGVVLLNVCLDDTEDKWQRTMMRIPMPGTNLYASSNTPLKLKYDLSRLPAYYIVDKAGNFAYLSDNGNRDILGEFDKLMQE